MSGPVLFVVCAVGAIVAAVGGVAPALPGRPQLRSTRLPRRAAAAAAVRSRGSFPVPAPEQAFGDGADSIPAPACRDGFDEETKRGLSHHRSSYLPLRFDCVRHDGSVCSSDPGYVGMNRASVSLTLAAALLVIGAGCATGFRARKTAVAS
nr:hypothetical protein [Streptomyces sp. NRRL S-37]